MGVLFYIAVGFTVVAAIFLFTAVRVASRKK